MAGYADLPPAYETLEPRDALDPYMAAVKSSQLSEDPLPVPAETIQHKVTRFFGDTLMGRMARAGVGTTTSAIKNFRTLSPWGDNNPVIVPNVRYRDAILFAAFSAAGGPMVEGIDTLIHDAFGSDNFIAEVVSTGADAIKESMAVKLAVFQVVEQAIDVGILEHLMPEEDKLITTGSVKTLRVQVRHKLMGVDADLQFKGQYPARDPGACAKGWFCPYLFASGRTPEIPRSHDFAMAEFWGPFIKSDEGLARALLSASPSVLSLCDPDPAHAFPAPRMLLLFTAIAPFRAGMWSTSRRPGCATMFFHLFDGCPALVVPVKPTAAASPPPLSRSSTATSSSSSSSSSKGKQRALPQTIALRVPVLAWSPWTLAQMMGPGRDGYGAAVQHRQLCEWLDGMLSVEHMHERVRGRYVELLGRSCKYG
ncbi:hypothetical protein UCRNP2_2133 [Neofusicoccum parvum UCRNP2]|uniref:Uncharacterized protein n=1 Tax=Botryosphaeria parva (strain UCR-NP2) TaxID=1287680 RepID=R1EU31_BOTPV|nr:hypothetical protein UCRNP2_2133 [Neofusicoccum parvum UCRNP2]